MKIGMFTNYYYPSWGGLELSIANLCAELKNAGHEAFSVELWIKKMVKLYENLI